MQVTLPVYIVVQACEGFLNDEHAEETLVNDVADIQRMYDLLIANGRHVPSVSLDEYELELLEDYMEGL